MKTKILTLFLLLIAAVASAETMRVAILEPFDRENKVSYGTKLILRANLAKAVTNTAGYEAYDRSDMDAILGEQNFQRTGMVSDDQIKRLGEMTGAKYILVAELAVIDTKNMFITAKVLDVETARTIITDNLMMGMDATSIQGGCATLAGNLFKASSNTQNNMNTSLGGYVFGMVNNGNTKLIKNSKDEIRLYGKSAYSYGGVDMDKKAMADFLKNNCPEAYKRYMKGKRLKNAGWSAFGVGLVFIALGSYRLADGKYYDYDVDRSQHIRDENAVDGGILLGLGLSGCCTSIPLLCVGYHRTNHAHEIFNRQCATKEKLTLNLQASQNGLGLALNF